MTIALSLLISAMQLLTMVQANPNLPPAFIAEVEIIANQAITTAKEEIAKAQATTTAPQPVQPQIIYVTVPTTNQEPMGSDAPVEPVAQPVAPVVPYIEPPKFSISGSGYSVRFDNTFDFPIKVTGISVDVVKHGDATYDYINYQAKESDTVIVTVPPNETKYYEFFTAGRKGSPGSCLMTRVLSITTDRPDVAIKQPHGGVDFTYCFN